MDAHVDESAECGDVGHRAFENHARGQVRDLFHALLEGRGLELGARVAAGLVQLGDDVGDGGHANAGGLVDEVPRVQRGQDARVADQFGHAQARRRGDAVDDAVGLGVHRGGVQRVGRAAHAEEAGALLEGLRAEARDLQQLLAGGEGAVAVAVGDDVLRHGRAHAGHAAEQRRRRGVDLHAHGIDGIFDDRIEGMGELRLRHVVLVLADADGLRVDLHQLGQRILQAAGDGHRTAQGHVHVREFGRGQRGGGVHRRARLRHRHRFGARSPGLDQQVRDLAGELVGLAGGGAVAHGHELDAVGGAQGGQGVAGGVPLVLRLVRVDDDGVEDLAGAVDHGALDAVAESRVQAQRRALPGGRGEQQVAQVAGEDLDGLGLGALLQAHAGVQRRGHLELGAPAEADGLVDPLGFGQVEGAADHALVDGVVAGVDAQLQDAFGLTAQDGQHAVAGHGLQRFGVLEIVAVLRAGLLLALDDARRRLPGRPHALADIADQVGVGGERLDENRAGAVQRVLRLGEALGDVPGRQLRRVGGRVRQQVVEKRLETGLAGDVGLGAALLLERQVEVLQPRLRVARQDQRAQVVGELALFLDGCEHRGLAVLEFAQVGQPFLDGAQLAVVEAAGGLLAVAGDEGHGVALVEELHGGGDVRLIHPEFAGDGGLDHSGECSGPGRFA